MVLLCVWTSPHVQLWGLCSLWVSLRCRQGLSAAGRVTACRGTVKTCVPVPVGGDSLCLSLVPAEPPELISFLSPRPTSPLSPQFEPVSSLLISRLALFPPPHPPFKNLGFLAFCFSASLSHCLSVLPVFTFTPLLPDLWSQDLAVVSPLRTASPLVVLTLLQLRNGASLKGPGSSSPTFFSLDAYLLSGRAGDICISPGVLPPFLS